MAGLGSKAKHAAQHPLSLVRSLAATLLSLAIIFAKATPTLETNPHTGKQPFKMPELTTGCLISETEVSQGRSLLGQEVNGSGCSELHKTSITRGRRNAQSFAEKPKMTATLAFVFDTTGSMSEDMAQARQGAKAILKAFMERDEVPVSNYILAPFNDPAIPAMTITENPDVFVNALNNLRADGGGDCPERACAGILNALRTAHPQSYLYVFTDAPAKDYQLYDKILEVNQRKRSQVTFILSGLCRYNEESVTVYDRIAGESGGQVFSVTKHAIKTVLDFVRDTLRGGDETIYSVRRPTPITKEPHSELFNMTVEVGLEELRITLTGNKPAVIVFNPLGVIIKNFVTILTLPNVIVVGILNPEPAGVWSVKVTIQPKTNKLATIPNGFALQVRATGVSYKILQGFSIQPSQSLQETANRPLEGTKNYLLVAIKPLQKSEEQEISLEKYTWDYVDIRKLNGEIYSTQALKPLPRTEDDETQILTFLAGPFEIPLDLFTLAFHGFDENGNPISRMPLNAISPAPISPPYVTMEPELEVMLGEPLALHCAVESLTPFTLDWYKNGDFFLGNLSYEQSHDAQLMIQSANKYDEALYTCKATNSKGSMVSPIGTALKIIVPPVIVRMGATKTEILENETVMLDCVVESEKDYTITWTLKQEGNIERLSNETNERIYLLKNDSLLITSFHHNDSGLYVCRAENKAGEVKREIELLLVLPPVLQTSKGDFYYTEGEAIELECKVDGKAGANITWELNGNPLPHLIKSSTRYAHSIRVPTQSNQWEGKYTCIAHNKAGKAQKEIRAMFWEPPSVQPLTNQHMSYAIGELATLSCAVSGIPPPKMSWQLNDQPIKNNQYYEISEDGLSLNIHGFNAATEGTYTCQAQSILNSTSRSDFHLILGTPPIASTSPDDLAIALGKEDWLHCNAETPVDFPRMEAKISWRRQHDIPIDLMRHEVLASGTLHIIDFQEQDEGIYICTMENDFGKIDLKAKLEVSINSSNSRHVVSGTTLVLNLLILILGTIML